MCIYVYLSVRHTSLNLEPSTRTGHQVINGPFAEGTSSCLVGPEVGVEGAGGDEDQQDGGHLYGLDAVVFGFSFFVGGDGLSVGPASPAHPCSK